MLLIEIIFKIITCLFFVEMNNDVLQIHLRHYLSLTLKCFDNIFRGMPNHVQHYWKCSLQLLLLCSNEW
jgi:hypothetical protein